MGTSIFCTVQVKKMRLRELNKRIGKWKSQDSDPDCELLRTTLSLCLKRSAIYANSLVPSVCKYSHNIHHCTKGKRKRFCSCTDYLRKEPKPLLDQNRHFRGTAYLCPPRNRVISLTIFKSFFFFLISLTDAEHLVDCEGMFTTVVKLTCSIIGQFSLCNIKEI